MLSWEHSKLLCNFLFSVPSFGGSQNQSFWLCLKTWYQSIITLCEEVGGSSCIFQINFLHFQKRPLYRALQVTYIQSLLEFSIRWRIGCALRKYMAKNHKKLLPVWKTSSRKQQLVFEKKELLWIQNYTLYYTFT